MYRKMTPLVLLFITICVKHSRSADLDYLNDRFRPGSFGDYADYYDTSEDVDYNYINSEPPTSSAPVTSTTENEVRNIAKEGGGLLPAIFDDIMKESGNGNPVVIEVEYLVHNMENFSTTTTITTTTTTEKTVHKRIIHKLEEVKSSASIIFVCKCLGLLVIIATIL